MEAQLASEVVCLLERLGDGHGRRVLVRATGAESVDVMLAIHLAQRGWAVSVRACDSGSAGSGRARTEAAAAVVEWRAEPLADRAAEVGRFAVATWLGAGGPDEKTCAELRRALRRDGLLLVVLAPEAAVPALPGFTGVSVARREDVVLVSARRA